MCTHSFVVFSQISVRVPSMSQIDQFKIICKLATLIKGDPKAPFSIATTLLEEGTTPFPGLLHFTFDPYLIILSVKQEGIKC